MIDLDKNERRRLITKMLGLHWLALAGFWLSVCGDESFRRDSRPGDDPSVDPNDFLLTSRLVLRRKIRSTTVASTSLNLSNMNITDTRLNEFLIKVEKNSTVTRLDLSQNRLVVLQESAWRLVGAAKNLHELDISRNRIVSIDRLPSSVVVLNVSGNNLGEDDSGRGLEFLTTAPQLQILDLSCNKFNSMQNISRVLAATLRQIKMLDLSCNHFTAIVPLNLSSLLHLDVAANAIGQLTRTTFSGLDRLERLNLAANAIGHIEIDTFLPLQNLQFLDVSHNRLTSGSIRALQGIPNLMGLSIAYNEELRSNLQGFVTTWSLKELDASGIGLCDVPTALTQSVKILNLADNSLQVILGNFLIFIQV